MKVHWFQGTAPALTSRKIIGAAALPTEEKRKSRLFHDLKTPTDKDQSISNPCNKPVFDG